MPAYHSDSKAGGTDEQQKQIYGHLNTDQRPDADEIADKLLSMALDAGGRDNVTLILYRDEEVSAWTQG